MKGTIKPALTRGLVSQNFALSGDTYVMSMECREVAALAAPGAFVKIRAWAAPEEGGAPLLDRPFSVHDTDGTTLSFLYRVVGPATRAMSRVTVGATLHLSGPLGHTLNRAMEKAPAPLYLVGGGVGLAPMRLALRWAPGSTVIYGEKSGAAQVEESWLKSWAHDFSAVTEDGHGYGACGLVTLPLEEALQREARPIFACGPAPMLEAVAKLGQKYGARVWASVEAGMACGFGVCLSCSLPLKGGGRFRACQEGPVVDAATIDWREVRP